MAPFGHVRYALLEVCLVGKGAVKELCEIAPFRTFPHTPAPSCVLIVWRPLPFASVFFNFLGTIAVATGHHLALCFDYGLHTQGARQVEGTIGRTMIT